MVDVGERVMIESEKVGQPARSGVVTAVEGSLLRIQWDGGGESTLVPGAGSLRVVGREVTEGAPQS